MSRLAGQAAHGLFHLLRWTAAAVLAFVVLACIGVGLLAWRLEQGPLDLPWLTRHIEAAVNAKDTATHLSVGAAALAWEGISQGVDRPLDLRLRAVDVTDSTGAKLISVPRASVSLSLFGLLLGRIEPRGIEVDDASVKVFRSAAGAISLDLRDSSEAGGGNSTADGPGIGLPAVLDELGKPAANDFSPQHGRFSELRHLRIRNASIVVVDHQLQITWRAPHAEIDLRRLEAGGVEGSAALAVALGDQTARLSVEAALAAGGQRTHLRADITPVAPAALARIATSLAPLSALDAPVGATITLDLGPALAVQQAGMTLRLGAGTLHLGSATIAVVDGTVVASGSPTAVTLQTARLSIRGHDDGDASVMSATGTMQRDPDRLRSSLALQLDQVDFADLPNLWPRGVGGVTREWITSNITAGTGRNGQLDLQVDARPDFSNMMVSAAHGTLDGEGLTVHWLRPLPPIVEGNAQLRIRDPDSIEIAVTSGRQSRDGATDDAGGLAVSDGTLTITGMQQSQQAMKVDASLTGSLADAVAVLRAPPLNLLAHQPVNLANVSGRIAAKLAIAMPLKTPPAADAMAVDAQAHLDDVHVTGLIAGRDLDQGAIDLKASRDGMTISGQAVLDDIPSTFDAAVDFHDGPASQVVQDISVAGQPTTAQLTKAGFNPAGVFAGGSVDLRVKLKQQRDGQAEVAVSADLANADMRLGAADWSKPAGAAAKADAILRVDQGRLVGIDRITLAGTHVSMQAHATVTAGGGSALQIDQFTLGRTSAKGSVRFPDARGGSIVATIDGTVLDLASRLSYHRPASERGDNDHASADTGGQAWTVNARFDHVLMANAQTFDGLTLHAEADGRLLTRLRFDARSGTGAPILLEVAPAPGGRQLTARAADAGRLMRALDVMETMEGGRLTIDGTFDDRAAGRPLSGTAEIQAFRIRNAPALARVLQAMTLYGLVNAVGGTGLGFDKLIAPFRLERSVLDLSQVRAFNASIGLTAQGRIDLAADTAELEGTIVPAYLFNSLLGRVPLLGKLFSPQTGGGLFAANYSVRGPLSDPKVSVNPLSALAPGFLRGLFNF